MIIAPDYAAVLHGVADREGQHALIRRGTAAGLIQRRVVRLTLGQNGTVKRRQLFQALRVGNIPHIWDIGAAGYIGALDPARVGDVSGKAQHVEADHQRNDRQHHGQHRSAQPAAAGEHAEGLVQQHLDAEVDDQARYDLAQHQHRHAAAAGHHVPQQDTQAHTAGQRDHIQHHGPQPAEHNGVAGRLAVAGAVEEIGGGDQRRGYRRINQQRCPAGGGQVLGIIAELCVRDERALAGSDLLIQANRRGQPVQPRGPADALITPEECLRQKSKQRVEGGKHKVDADIDDGDGQQPASDHGAQRSQRKVEQTGQLRHSEPLQRAPYVDGAASGLHRQGNQRRRQMHHGEHQHAHGEVNGELAAPGDGQGVQQTHAAAVHQIGV